MYVIQLMGGLGNQLFEYSAAYVAAKHKLQNLKIDKRYYLDTSKRFHRFQYRPYALSLFNIPSEEATFQEINQFVLPRLRNKYLYHLLKNLHRDHNVYNEKALPTYNDLINIPTNDAYLTGYFQKYEYFANHLDEIKRIFTFKDPLPESHNEVKQAISKTENSICVVFRRGDYVGHPILDIINLEFYYKAIDILRSKINDINIFVFSDDIPWCQSHFHPQGCNVSFIDQKYTGLYGGCYLQLMMLCNHFIIPNSTYPYWAALLSNTNQNKIVIAPKIWHKGQQPNTRNSILPSDWIAI